MGLSLLLGAVLGYSAIRFKVEGNPQHPGSLAPEDAPEHGAHRQAHSYNSFKLNRQCEVIRAGFASIQPWLNRKITLNKRN